MDTTTPYPNNHHACIYRLPCGICTRTNTVCPLQGFNNDPYIVSVYAAPGPPTLWNSPTTITTTTITTKGSKDEGEIK